jgi:hypothetical protein
VTRLANAPRPFPRPLFVATTAPIGLAVLGLLSTWTQIVTGTRPPTPQQEATLSRDEASLAARSFDRAIAGLRSTTDAERCSAAFQLKVLGRPDAVAPLQQAFAAAKDSTTRVCTTAALGVLDGASVLDTYRDWVHGDSATLRKHAIDGLAEVSPNAADAAVALLDEALETVPPAEQPAVVAALGRLRPHAVLALERATRHDSVDVRRVAEAALNAPR